MLKIAHFIRFFGSFSVVLAIFYSHIITTPFAQGGTTTLQFQWGTSINDGGLLDDSSDAPTSSYQLLKKLNPNGSLGDAIDGGLIELGFFDNDGALDGGYTINTDASNPFSGVWTPITSESVIGHDWGSSATDSGVSRSVDDGQFYFNTYIDQTSGDLNDLSDMTISGSQHLKSFSFPSPDLEAESASDIIFDNDDGANTGITASLLEARMQALHDQSTGTNPIIGIRFYDTAPSSDGSGPGTGALYNTIASTNWRAQQFPSTGTQKILMDLYDSSGSLDTANLKFEFDNNIGNSIGSEVGSDNVTVNVNQFVSTVTYYSGSGDLDASGASSIFSGLSGGSGSKIGLGDGRTYTFNSLDTNNSSSLAGNVVKQDGGGSANAKVIKSGEGEQELTGEFKIEGSTADLIIYDGTLKLNPSSADTQIVESIGTVSGGTPVLELDNTGVGGNEIVEIGLANSTTPKEYSGAITLSGTNGTVNKITVGSADQQSKEQIFSGAITGTNDLVKDGSARLRISGDSTSTFSGDVIVEDGTLVVGNGSTDGSNLDSDNKITINKGKLEVAKNETLGVTVEGGTGKSMIGGGGTIGTVNLGAVVSTDIDYISPGRGISSSLSPSKKQVNFDANESTSIDTLTVNTLNWNDGGVFDWQIKDFDPSGGTEGEDWDFLSITSLNFESGKTFDINLMAISSTDGTQGAPDNLANTWTSGNYDQTNGFWFMSAGTVTGMGTGDVTDSFNIRTEDFSYSANNWMGNWGVWRDGGDFYLTYSAVPEPSTYMMVTGLLMVPGMSYVRRYRNKKKGIEVGEDNQSS